MTLLAVDVGTTHCKAALFSLDGKMMCAASRPMAPARASDGDYAYYDPEWLWRTVADLIGEVIARAARPRIAALGIASMAETGLLLDRHSDSPCSPLLPWFDTAAAPLTQPIERQAPALERFRTFGTYPSFKCSLAKILWWRERVPQALTGAAWLSVADYVAHRLTGALATDYSLACRTYAFDLDQRAWASAWLEQFGLSADMFPAAAPAGTACGITGPDLAAIGLAPGIPVAIAGHDHVCAAFAAGVAPGGRAFDSMGTAEALIGALDVRPLGAAEFATELSFGYMPGGQAMYWIGGLSTSGGALEWLRGILGDPPLSYEALQQLQEEIDDQPGPIVFLPYLAGSGAPRQDPALRAAFTGLDAAHGRADLLKAVLEGTAYQMEAVRRAAAGVVEAPIDQIAAAGGGTRNRRWIQIKADVYGARIEALVMDEATLLGAALIAGVGAGVYGDVSEAQGVASTQPSVSILPNTERQLAYARGFSRFWAWQELLRNCRL